MALPVPTCPRKMGQRDGAFTWGPKVREEVRVGEKPAPWEPRKQGQAWLAAPWLAFLPNVLLGILPVKGVNTTLGGGARWPYHHQDPGYSSQTEPSREPPDSLPELKVRGFHPSNKSKTAGQACPLSPSPSPLAVLSANTMPPDDPLQTKPLG